MEIPLGFGMGGRPPHAPLIRYYQSEASRAAVTVSSLHGKRYRLCLRLRVLMSAAAIASHTVELMTKVTALMNGSNNGEARKWIVEVFSSGSATSHSSDLYKAESKQFLHLFVTHEALHSDLDLTLNLDPGLVFNSDNAIIVVLAINSAPDHGPVIDVNSDSIVKSDLSPSIPIAVLMPILVLLGPSLIHLHGC
ncbi:hypothetical protein EVAR_63290_1 [Eumeta japonica]|uniref:Uncharacterized protein n=1 Tax=Eumeta variegata TaxID=151549 RepID=A0A4C2A0N7_EUMVA|nr:hypothetical protein EVAR_63290_1 [Eumeta japonica]